MVITEAGDQVQDLPPSAADIRAGVNCKLHEVELNPNAKSAPGFDNISILSHSTGNSRDLAAES